jgi:hypothetical protein
LHPDLSKGYDLLGVKPGVSNRELKAAHRDLAKVWHPDRFLHDPRLQEKAQEKLKEINEAYELLISGKVPKPSRSAETVYSESPVTRRRASGSQWTAVPLLIFVAVFAITITLLLQRRRPAPLPVEETQIATLPQETAPQSDSRTRSVVKPNAQAEAPEVSSTEVVTPAPVTALATVTVTIDPESGLLAKQDCPVRSRMTYPTGSQPTGYCNLNHTPPPKESKIKSLAKSVGRALD